MWNNEEALRALGGAAETGRSEQQRMIEGRKLMSGRGTEERGRHKGLERRKTRKNKEKSRQSAEGGVREAGVEGAR